MGIVVKVRAGAGLVKSLLGKGPLQIQLDECSSVSEVARLIGVNPTDVNLVVINGARASLDSIPSDGDEIELHWFMHGG